MAQNRQALRLDRFAAPFTAAIDAHIQLRQRLVDLRQMLFRALTQGQVELPLIDHGVPLAEIVVAFHFQTTSERIELLLHLSAFGEQARTSFGDLGAVRHGLRAIPSQELRSRLDGSFSLSSSLGHSLSGSLGLGLSDSFGHGLSSSFNLGHGLSLSDNFSNSLSSSFNLGHGLSLSKIGRAHV